jgi:hypothetical protein
MEHQRMLSKLKYGLQWGKGGGAERMGSKIDHIVAGIS